MGLSKSSPSNRPSNGQVKLLVRPTAGRMHWGWLSWAALGGGAALMVVVILSGARLIVDPYSPNWLKTAFPGLVNSFEAVPQTRADIRAEMRSQNVTPGNPVAWPNPSQPKIWFYPVIKTNKTSVQEIWVYRTKGDQLQRIEQIAIRPLKESFITTPLVGTASQVASVDSDATLTSVQLMPGKSAAEPWLLLEGQRRYGNTVMRYGQILSYQPHSQRLRRLLNWSSSANQSPRWQTSTSGKQLIVDQTVGLRPNFLLYQLVPSKPPRLQEVSLYRSVYGTDVGTSLYDKALKLAQGAVWSHSLQMMTSAKTALGQGWSPEAQTQLDLIQLHAARTETQTKQTWSSQQQHILAYLIDGQWNKALNTLENNPEIYDSTLKQLERDFDALWRGVTTHLQVHPQDVATQVWGALLVRSRQSPEAGENWLKKKTPSKTALERLQTLEGQYLVHSDINLVEDGMATSGATDTLLTTNSSGRYRSLVGQATAIGTPGDGWLRSQTTPTLLPGQTWYQIDIQLLQDSSGWGRSPLSITAAHFWAESLSLRDQLQLFNNNQSIAGVTVHGVKTTGAGLAFLAVGPKIEGSTLVTTPNSLRWSETLPWQTAPATFTDSADIENHYRPNGLAAPPPLDGYNAAAESPQAGLAAGSQTEPQIEPRTELQSLIADTMRRQLGLTAEQTAQLNPYFQYARIDLMGDTTTEHIFSIGPGLPPELGLIPGKTMIFSNTGSLLYSDVGQQQTLLAMTDKSHERPATLLVRQAGRYRLIGF